MLLLLIAVRFAQGNLLIRQLPKFRYVCSRSEGHAPKEVSASTLMIPSSWRKPRNFSRKEEQKVEAVEEEREKDVEIRKVLQPSQMKAMLLLDMKGM